MGAGLTIGYVNFTVMLFLLAGTAILRIDVKAYEAAGMNKEKKAARFLGWFNIGLGLVTLIGNLIVKGLT
ncbi:hypothetical protein SD70_11290 [Gordoniibacillus kamchatkensis]|uniref:Uncharacterized protein n=1 Tax=Gordoniibacillus kamchatkensis TaxID=1590651 RepID=A0ABR5AKB5_9BACL|nr:CLC_0170 family protein [Paenibacillus sp. VKM B-2647]KIL40812.1 hypothetical protein SD70_11290 [Paenibacillus sp. VKM B-2647]